MLPPNALPDDIEALKAALIEAQAEAAAARAQLSADQALIAHLKLQIEKFKRERFGQRSERTARLIDQLELQLEELEASATEDELAAERAAAKTTTVAALRASGRRANRTRSICRASGSSSRHRLPACAAAASACASWARMSPRRWR